MYSSSLSQEPTKGEWLHLSISNSGSRILSVGGFPGYHLDVWDISAVLDPQAIPSAAGGASNLKSPSPGQQHKQSSSGSETATAVNVARVPLGDRLVDLGCFMFPLNTNIIAACGKHAVRLINLDSFPNHCTIRQVSQPSVSITLVQCRHLAIIGIIGVQWFPLAG